ncbi:bacterial Ig-like domain-containing protein [Bacillus sp. N9]
MTDAKVAKLPKKTTYFIGESFDPDGLILEATYSNGNSVELSAEQYTLETENFTSAGVKTVTVSIPQLPEKTLSFTITVKDTEGTNNLVAVPALEGNAARAEVKKIN